MRREPHIFMAGTGIRTADHFTRETEAILQASNEVLYVDTGIATRAFLEERCRKVTDLYAESYSPGRGRLDAYQHMAARVIEAALEHPPVTFAMHGHPVVYSYAPFLVADMAKMLDLVVEVLPGISSHDCLFAELMLDPSVSGLVMYEATDLLLRRRPLHPDVPTLLWQVGNLETRLHSTRPSRPERLDRLTGYLLSAYPPGHPVTAVHISPHALIPSAMFTFPLASIGEHARVLHAGVTLYLPPARTRPIADLDLLRKIDDPEHLRAITD